MRLSRVELETLKAQADAAKERTNALHDSDELVRKLTMQNTAMQQPLIDLLKAWAARQSPTACRPPAAPSGCCNVGSGSSSSAGGSASGHAVSSKLHQPNRHSSPELCHPVPQSQGACTQESSCNFRTPCAPTMEFSRQNTDAEEQPERQAMSTAVSGRHHLQKSAHECSGVQTLEEETLANADVVTSLVSEGRVECLSTKGRLSIRDGDRAASRSATGTEAKRTPQQRSSKPETFKACISSF